MVTKREITTGYANVNDARLYFETAGDGEALVFVHAGIADNRLWDHQFRHFADDYLTVRYDMRGYGQSSIATEDFSHTRDLAALLSLLGIRSAILVGCSMGGMVAIDLALAYPRLVRALVTVGSTPAGWRGSEEHQANPPQWDETVAAFKAGDLERTSKLETQIWVDGESRTPNEVDPAVRALVYEMNLNVLQKEVAANGAKNNLLHPDAAEKLDTLTVPVLAIAGALDRPYAVAAVEGMAAQLPNAQSAIIEATAHVPSLERPEAFNKILANWLKMLD
jgi:pimeloyl-ACP methyl ester carboxylesterase